MKNGDRWDTSWVESFRHAGYRTLNVGKMHTQPFDAPCGFVQRFVTENKDRIGSPRFYDEWDKHLKQRGIANPNRWTYQERDDFDSALGAFAWPLDEELHFDAFVGRNAEWLIREHSGSPLFMQIGFPGPHTPYDPPQRYLDRLGAIEIPPVVPFDAERDIPPHVRYRQIMTEQNHGGVRWRPDASAADFHRLRRHYAANMLLIDDWIGRILDAARDAGLLDNAIIVCLSDHGDSLGDHGQIQKWTMHDCNVRVPAIAWAPGRLPSGRRIADLIQHFDLAALLFDLAGLPWSDHGVARSPRKLIEGDGSSRDTVFAEHGRCNMLPNIEHMAMVRTDAWKLVRYAGRDYGELYDLHRDPNETDNLWAMPTASTIKSDLMAELDKHAERHPPSRAG